METADTERSILTQLDMNVVKLGLSAETLPGQDPEAAPPAEVSKLRREHRSITQCNVRYTIHSEWQTAFETLPPQSQYEISLTRICTM